MKDFAYHKNISKQGEKKKKKIKKIKKKKKIVKIKNKIKKCGRIF